MHKILPVFKALSDETRLRIIKLLENGELCVCDITDALEMTQPNISFHLGMLKEAGLIRDRKNGRWTNYSLDDSDIFIRFLLVGVLEKLSDSKTAADRERIMKLLAVKKECTEIPISATRWKEGTSKC